MKQQQQQMMKNGDFAEFRLRNGRRNGGDGRAQAQVQVQAQGASMAAWPGLQEAGSGMRAVYLGEPGPKKERTGTGVFLPQRFGSLPAQTRKKSGDLAALVTWILFFVFFPSIFRFSVRI